MMSELAKRVCTGRGGLAAAQDQLRAILMYNVMTDTLLESISAQRDYKAFIAPPS